MSDTPPNDPSSSPPPPPDPQGPWIYSGGSVPAGFYSDPTRAAAPGAGATLPPAVPPPASPSPVAAPVPAARRPATVRTNDDAGTPKSAELASVIDTIEAIIIALIIALTFRAFIVEAFVIPTGSMAPTLLGAHFRVVCPECGYEFDRNADLHWQLDGNSIVQMGKRAELRSNTSIPSDDLTFRDTYCPNCGYAISPAQFPDALVEQSSTLVSDRDHNVRKVPFAWANNGDRILVLKYIYSIMDPARWDVIVFKEPEEARDNYIKRLIGRPGETIEVIDGDVYISPPGQTSLESRAIARKPDYVQSNVWQLVYDNDYYPLDEGKPRTAPQPMSSAVPPIAARPWTNPWSPGAGWARGPVMKYSGQGASELLFNSEAPYTVNVLGYNNDIHDDRQASYVGDLRVETTWTPMNDSAATLAIVLGRKGNCYRATLKSKQLTLEEFDPVANAPVPNRPVITETAVPAIIAGHPYRIAMNDVDHVVQFSIDGAVCLNIEHPWTAKDAFDQIAKNPQPPPARIAIDVGGACTLAHLKLLRDLYYCQSNPGNPETANANHPLTLNADEFFAMGDNSRQSLDGRMWKDVFPALDDLGTRPGIVPRRYLLGKAFFVYWPAGFRASTSIPYVKETPIVPNFGSMRFIR